MWAAPELSSQTPARLQASKEGVTPCRPRCQREVKKKCSTCLLYSWREAAQTTTSCRVKNKTQCEVPPLPLCTCHLPPFGRSSINAGTAIKRREVSKMARADAGHLAPCVWDDSATGLKGPEIERVDIWASDCLNMESPGLVPLGINPLILPRRNLLIIFHLARIRSSICMPRGNFHGLKQRPNLGFNGSPALQETSSTSSV